MSVILTGMDMPDDCESCQYSQCDFHGTEWFSGSSNMNYSWCMAYDCPLRSVNGLIEKIENACCITIGRECDPAITIMDVKKIIKEYCGMEDK